jgi:hypothetical protein
MQKKKPMRLPWWGVLCVIIGALPISFAFYHFGRFDLALPTECFIGMLGIAIAMRWKLRRHVWFWITMAVIAALHVPLILFIHWTTKWVPAFVTTPFAVADLFVILLILSWVGKFIEGQEPPKDERPGSSRRRQDQEV